MDDRKPIGVGAFIVGGLSFIPLLGVPFGIAALIWGLVSRAKGAKIVAAMGTLGVAVTIALYGSLFYFGFAQRGGVYDGLRSQLASGQLNQLVPVIETYKVRHGAYPTSIDDLTAELPTNSGLSIYDPSNVNPAQTRKFYYEAASVDHYYLRGVGPDEKPFTADDLVPVITGGTAGLGLLIERPAPLPPVAK